MVSFIYTVVSLVLVVPTTFALPRGGGGNTRISQCNVGPVQCCNSVQSSQSTAIKNIFGQLGLDVTTLGQGQVGLTCSSVGSGSNSVSCNASPVCCTGNSFNGLINVGCSPVSL